jgi:hypothetical protein
MGSCNGCPHHIKVIINKLLIMENNNTIIGKQFTAIIIDLNKSFEVEILDKISTLNKYQIAPVDQYVVKILDYGNNLNGKIFIISPSDLVSQSS